ncbi:hypothetical protein PR048_032722 [Dryococelus australis]|uniref:Uncharacterized protein n=1 Tax=Dryococelus australis TaxID=614101 RepID=A0ABQ9G5U9_9NEOP|nr:hypothetical protein PR048_032722 [Dryococelus australis]
MTQYAKNLRKTKLYTGMREIHARNLRAICTTLKLLSRWMIEGRIGEARVFDVFPRVSPEFIAQYPATPRCYQTLTQSLPHSNNRYDGRSLTVMGIIDQAAGHAGWLSCTGKDRGAVLGESGRGGGRVLFLVLADSIHPSIGRSSEKKGGGAAQQLLYFNLKSGMHPPPPPPVIKVKKRGNNTGDTNTHFKRLIAPTRKECSVSAVTLYCAIQICNSGVLLHAIKAHRLHYARILNIYEAVLDGVLKTVHDKVSTFVMNLRKKSLSLTAYILTGTLSDMRPVTLAGRLRAIYTAQCRLVPLFSQNRRFHRPTCRRRTAVMVTFCQSVNRDLANKGVRHQFALLSWVPIGKTFSFVKHGLPLLQAVLQAIKTNIMPNKLHGSTRCLCDFIFDRIAAHIHSVFCVTMYASHTIRCRLCGFAGCSLAGPVPRVTPRPNGQRDKNLAVPPQAVNVVSCFHSVWSAETGTRRDGSHTTCSGNGLRTFSLPSCMSVLGSTGRRLILSFVYCAVIQLSAVMNMPVFSLPATDHQGLCGVEASTGGGGGNQRLRTVDEFSKLLLSLPRLGVRPALHDEPSLRRLLLRFPFLRTALLIALSLTEARGGVGEQSLPPPPPPENGRPENLGEEKKRANERRKGERQKKKSNLFQRRSVLLDHRSHGASLLRHLTACREENIPKTPCGTCPRHRAVGCTEAQVPHESLTAAITTSDLRRSGHFPRRHSAEGSSFVRDLEALGPTSVAQSVDASPVWGAGRSGFESQRLIGSCVVRRFPCRLGCRMANLAQDTDWWTKLRHSAGHSGRLDEDCHSINTLASHQGEPGSIPDRVTGFSQVGIVLDDAVGRRVFSGISRFPPPLHPGAAPNSLQSPSSALKTSLLRAAQISSVTHSHLSASGMLLFEGDMHRGKEGLDSHGLHFGAMTTSLSVLRASLNYEEQGKNRQERREAGSCTEAPSELGVVVPLAQRRAFLSVNVLNGGRVGAALIVYKSGYLGPSRISALTLDYLMNMAE